MEDIQNEIKNSDFFIIAELGMNHDGSLGNAFRLIEEAKEAGVDAVKFQLHISEAETLKDAPTPPYFKLEERYEYFERTSFVLSEWEKLKTYANELGLYFIVSPFSLQAVNKLEKIKIDAYKIASGETTNLPLLDYIDQCDKPVLLSSGMSNWNEISNAVQSLKKNLLVIFQCSSQYPCHPEDVGLNILKELKERYAQYVIGFSDHTLNCPSAIAAYLMGAKVFEKHFTLSKKMYGADARFSLEPDEMKEYVDGLKFISKALKNPIDKNDISKYNTMKTTFEKSIVAARNLTKNHKLQLEDLNFKKPGDGLRADNYRKVIGKKLKRDIKQNEKIKFNDLL